MKPGHLRQPGSARLAMMAVVAFATILAVIQLGMTLRKFQPNGFGLAVVLAFGVFLTLATIVSAFAGQKCPACSKRPLKLIANHRFHFDRFARCTWCKRRFVQQMRRSWQPADSPQFDSYFAGSWRTSSRWLDPSQVDSDASTTGKLLKSKRGGDLDRLGEPLPPSSYQLGTSPKKSERLGPGETTQGRLLKNKQRRGWSLISAEFIDQTSPTPTVYDHWVDGGPR